MCDLISCTFPAQALRKTPLPSSQSPTVCLAWHCRRMPLNIHLPLARVKSFLLLPSPSASLPPPSRDLTSVVPPLHRVAAPLQLSPSVQLLDCSTVLSCFAAVQPRVVNSRLPFTYHRIPASLRLLLPTASLQPQLTRSLFLTSTYLTLKDCLIAVAHLSPGSLQLRSRAVNSRLPVKMASRSLYL